MTILGVAGACLIGLQLVDAASSTIASCHTVFGNTSRSTVPTRTTTTTTYIGSTRTISSGTFTHTGPIYYVTSTFTYHYTYYSVIGNTTTTIPLSPGFTPLTSAKSIRATTSTTTTTSNPKTKRAVPSLSTTPSSTLYPQSVLCTRNITHTGQTVTTPATTITITPTTFTYVPTVYGDSVHTTTHVATATVHAACQPAGRNVLNSFRGRGIANYSTPKQYYDVMLPHACSGLSGDCHFTGNAQDSAEACCEAVMLNFYRPIGFSDPPYAFAYSQSPGEEMPTCRPIMNNDQGTVWNFTTGVGHPNGLYIGNVADGQPYYVGST